MEFDSIPHLSRRALLETFLAAGSLPLLAETRADAQVPGAAATALSRGHSAGNHRQDSQPRA